MLLALAAFTVAAVLIVLLPGPDTLVTIRSIVRGGRSSGTATAGGILVGLTIWICVAALGLAAVLRASEVAYAVLRIVGACYLVWLGVQSLRAMRRGAPAVDDGARRGLLGTGFAAGLTTNLLNPKVGVFFVTFLPGFVPSGYPVGATSLLFGADFLVLSVIYYVVLLALASKVTAWMAAPRVRRRMDALTGTVLVGFGIRLAVES
ncbi:MAG: LysE family translocator [Jatrophihabitans sp.]|jgi:threonine/homoserine/homoserine lactone efflux protein|uniref:LysE family translocator n=1 Tax=Jatrophihabitans sp. TaxID=1932789 RepID=UPI003916674C